MAAPRKALEMPTKNAAEWVGWGCERGLNDSGHSFFLRIIQLSRLGCRIMQIAMITIHSTFRCLITASLLLSLSTLSLFPRLMVGQALGLTVSSGIGAKHCCCGTKDGRCCGMACCQASPNPQEKQAPAAPQLSEDRGQPLGLAPAVNVAVVGLNTAAFRDGCFRDAASTSSPSLIALSIRLNT